MIKLSEKNYLSVMLILTPLINFISGLVVDLYAPSMPAIALYFNSSEPAVQNTITLFIFGWSVGGLFWGMLYDVYGRKKIIILALTIFVISSLAAIYCHNILQLIMIRFIQGITTAALSVGSRALVADHFSGHRFNTAILNISIAYGIGTIIGPFIGGYLQHHVGWQANFYAFVLSGMIILFLVKLLVQERFKPSTEYRLKEAVWFYKILLTHKNFVSGCMIIGISQVELLLYPTVAPFLVEHNLGYSAIVYGNSALLVGAAYVMGAMTNRFLLRFISQKNLLNIGFLISAVALLIQSLFILDKQFNLFALNFPIIIMCFGNGFVFGNIISNCIQLFKKNAGMATAFQIVVLMAIAGIGIFLVTVFGVSSLSNLFSIMLITLILKALFYYFGFKQIFARRDEGDEGSSLES